MIFVAIHERPQKHAPDHAEDGSVCANTQGQSEDYRNGEALSAKERPSCDSQVIAESNEAFTQSRSCRVLVRCLHKECCSAPSVVLCLKNSTQNERRAGEPKIDTPREVFWSGVRMFANL